MTIAQITSGGIVVDHVRRSFGGVHAARDASFTAIPGTVTGLIGPNGSGKTTLMLMLASLLQPEGGSIRIAGFDPMDATAEVRSRMGWMPDVLGSWANLSVRSTLEYAARMYGMDLPAASARAGELVSIVDLADLASSPTRVLSRGQKQRLSLARALVHNPEVLLLDEPASGLDPGARTHLRVLVRRLASEGKTILVSSHVLAELDEMADGVVYIDGGVTASADVVARSRASAQPCERAAVRARGPGASDHRISRLCVPASSRRESRMPRSRQTAKTCSFRSVVRIPRQHCWCHSSVPGSRSARSLQRSATSNTPSWTSAAAGPDMSAFFSGVWVILTLELRQRVRTVSWYVLIGVFIGLIAIVTVVLSVALRGFEVDNSGGAGVYSTIIYFVLLLGTLVAPALSGNAINGDRDAGTLATTQVTLITTWELIIGKFLAAWVTALAFLAAAVPFLIYASTVGRLGGGAIAVSLLILAVELGVVAAIGVGLSGLVSRPLFSVVLSYLVVAALSIGTLIAFTLGGLAMQSKVTNTSSYGVSYSDSGQAISCSPVQTTTYPTPRFDLFWGVLAANPYVVLADAVPSTYDSNGYPTDLFGQVKFGIRSAQITPETEVEYDECADGPPESPPTAREIINSTTPGWFVGLVIHLLLAAGALTGAWARTRTPASRLSRGSRIA